MRCKKIIVATGFDCHLEPIVSDITGLVLDGLVHLPEADGPQACLDRVVDAMLCHEEVLVVTRFSESVNFVGSLIGSGVLLSEQVVVALWQKGERSECSFDAEGVLRDGWPFGCLMPDFDAAEDRLRGRI